MAKKPRSQRRKKGKSSSDLFKGNSPTEGTHGGRANHHNNHHHNNDNGNDNDYYDDNDDNDNDEGTDMGAGGVAAEFLSDEHTLWGDEDGSITSAFSIDATTANSMLGDDEYNHSTNNNNDTNNTNNNETRGLLRLQTAWHRLDEYASEKRSARREATMRRLFQTMIQYAVGPTAQHFMAQQPQHLDSILSACTYAIRHGPPVEQYAACRVLEATAVVVLGNGNNNTDMDDEWCERIEPLLRLVVRSTQRAVPVRAAALRAWSLTVFFAAIQHETDTVVVVRRMMIEALCDVCEQVAQEDYRQQPVPASLRATALDCWGLLVTILPPFHVAGRDDVTTGRGLQLLPLLRDALDHASSVDLRSAAGECVALIHECRLALGQDSAAGKNGAGGGGGSSGGWENVTARQFRPGSWEDCGAPYDELMDEIKQRVAELSVESGHQLSKKVKKEQRATFREFLATIVDDDMPEEVVQLRHAGTLHLSSWKEIIQLNFIRHCLQGGFQVQLVRNETLQRLFASGWTSNGRSNRHSHVGSGGLSQLEKRLLLSKNSDTAKWADQQLTRQRNKREHIKNDFLTADGEDI